METSTLNVKIAEVLLECTNVCGYLSELINIMQECPAEAKEKENLQKAFGKFGNEIHRISELVKNRANLQTRKRLTRRIYQLNGIGTNDSTQTSSRRTRHTPSSRLASGKSIICAQPEIVSFEDFANDEANEPRQKYEQDDEYTIRNPPSIPPF